MSTYPRIGAAHPLSSGHRCALCFKAAMYAVAIEFNNLRRDDHVTGLCAQHLKWGRDNPMALVDRIDATEDVEDDVPTPQFGLLDSQEADDGADQSI
jgi:hypothetical protein